MEREYKIFIASCKRMLEQERAKLSESISKYKYLYPVQMDRILSADNSESPLNVDMKKIEESDAVICIFSYLYGEIIGKKIKSIRDCPLQNCQGPNCSCSEDKGCTISFPEFEYRYANKVGKTPVVILNERYSNRKQFEKDLEGNINEDDIISLRGSYYKYIEPNYQDFLQPIISKVCYKYDPKNEHSFGAVSGNAVSAAVKKICANYRLPDSFFVLEETNNANKNKSTKSEYLKFLSQYIDKSDYIELRNPKGSMKMIEKVRCPNLMSWDEALQYAKNLRKGGFDDWRLPTIDELKYIYKISDYGFQYIAKIEHLFDICGINQKDFWWFWSSSSSGTDFAWYVDFMNGKYNYSYKDRNYSVRCVR